MKHALALVISMILASAVLAQSVPRDELSHLVPEGETPDLSQFLWKNRLLIVFADSPGDPRFIQQMELLAEHPEKLVERDVVLLIDTDPAALGPLRTEFRPHGFAFLLIGKDGNRYLRKPMPWDVREITRSIDKMPIRRREMQNR